ncbi:MAG: alpha-L-fucosidase [Planctomycetes bacterium]|nr:alpha-L-fucosidase [Planctomycetota bacterium]
MRPSLSSVVLALALLGVATAPAQSPTRAPDAGPRPYESRLQWWAEARFGLFVHWGPVSLAGTEIGWSRGAQVPIAEYDQLHERFDPRQFDAAAWAKVAANAGMKYVVLTTKHHDGFCLWDSALTDHSIAHTPFRRDVAKELAEACRAQGLVFCAYHSICDWHHPDYPLGSPGGRSKKPNPDMARYESYLRGQLQELFTRCGPLGLVWFDGEWEEPWTRERGDALYRYCRSLQDSVIVNNRVSKARQGMGGTSRQSLGNAGDYDTPEQAIGKYQDQRPWESCITICSQWAWKPADGLKSLPECLHTLLRCAGGDGNLLLNVGPMPDGRIEPRQQERLAEIGAWLASYGESVHGTRGGPWLPARDVVTTRKDRSVFVHVLRWRDEVVTLPPIARRITGSALLTGGEVEVEQHADGVVLRVSPADRKELDTLVRLDLDGPAMELAPIDWPRPMAGVVATATNVYERAAAYGADRAIDGDPDTRWATDRGTEQATLDVVFPAPVRIRVARIAEWGEGGERVRAFELQADLDGVWRTLHKGTTIGPHWEQTFDPVLARRFRLRILDASEGPTIEEFELRAK